LWAERGAMDVVVVAAFEDFDETQDKRQRGAGCGRKHATQALIHYLTQQAEDVIRKVGKVHQSRAPKRFPFASEAPKRRASGARESS